jgi:hypothetical protein
MEVAIGELPPERWSQAGAMVGRAFWAEDYNRILSEDPIERFAMVQNVYLRMTPGARILAAFAGDHVVGVACVDGAETCFFCSLDPAGPRRTDRASQVLNGVNLAIKDLHVDLPLDCDPRLVGFYESCGFRPVGVVTDPYGFDIVGLRRDPV